MPKINICPVCEAQDFIFSCLRGDGKKIITCTRCGIGLLDMIPDDKEIDAIYDKDYFFIIRAIKLDMVIPRDLMERFLVDLLMRCY